MAEKRQPWMKWYPADWRQEPTLRVCSRAARSLWQDMLGLMHEADPYGYLVLAGQAMTPKQLAAILGDRAVDVTKWLAELSAAGVYSTDETGRIYSRRMVRDRDRSQEGREWAERRWANRGPTPKQHGSPNGRPNGSPTDNPNAHMPEARDQKPEREDLTPEFEVWYRVYPRRVDRGHAAKEYQRARKKADPAVLLAGAQRYAAECQGKDPRYVKHPGTWLSGECWLDQPAQPTPEPAKSSFNF